MINKTYKIIIMIFFFIMISCTQKEEGIQIRLLTRFSGISPATTVFRQILEEFDTAHPDITIIDVSQGDESAFNNILKTDLASGTLPNIFRIQGIANLSEYIKNGLIMDMEPILKADPVWGENFILGALNYYRVPGFEGIYGIPMETGLVGFFYNEALFKKVGIETFPETWDEFIVAIKKLKENNIIPIALGARSSYTIGHVHNQIFYKWLGVDATKQLGSREKKWTDADVVQTLKYVEELNKIEAFSPSAPGIVDAMALSQFQNGEAAMVLTGSWNISILEDPEKTPVSKDVRFAKFPYFKEKPQYKNSDMQVISPYMINGKLEGEELKLTIDLVKSLTSKEAGNRFLKEASWILPRTDIDTESTTQSSLLNQHIKLSRTSTEMVTDVFDFDPLPSMQDKTRNSLVGLLLGKTPEETAMAIQQEIDNSLK